MESAVYLLVSGLILSVSTPTNNQQLPPFLIGYYPCRPGDNVSLGLDGVRECDVFTYAASKLALERSNMKMNKSLKMLFSTYSASEEDVTNILVTFVQTFSDAVRRYMSDHFLDQILGIVGPGDNLPVARHYTYVTTVSLKLPQVTYGAKDNTLNWFARFYRTLPSISTLNTARVRFLNRMGWSRVGLISSEQEVFINERENFEGYFRRFIEDVAGSNLTYSNTLTHSDCNNTRTHSDCNNTRTHSDYNNLNKILQDISRTDLRIVLGFFSPEDARNVLCQGSKYNLTTSDHVWILPAYYNPEWWRESAISYRSNSSECSDDEMVEILNSAIFMDTVKYPPLDLGITDFYSQLLYKTRELFHVDPHVQLEQFLQHSRAVSAYDATMVLTESVRPEGSVDYSKLHSLLACEVCRIHASCPTPFTKEEMFCEVFCSSNSDNVSTQRPDDVLHKYGQILVTQFINGTHCPMLMFWSSYDNVSSNMFVPVSCLGNVSCSKYLGLNASSLFFNITQCPTDFHWKGRNSAPDGRFAAYSRIDVWAIAIVTVFCSVGVVFTLSLMIFSIAWRKNPHVKSGSPMINLVILFGALLIIPFPIPQAFVLSNFDFNFDKLYLTITCQVNLWLPTLGHTLLISALLVKNWRLYRIFKNKSLNKELKYLGNRYLVAASFLLLTPAVVTLIVWNSVSPYVFTEDLVEVGEFQFLYISTCSSDSSQLTVDIELLTFRILVIYAILLYVAVTTISYFTARVPETVRLELQATKLALATLIVPKVTLMFVEYWLTKVPLWYVTLWWIQVMDFVFLTVTFISVLCLYQVYYVLKDHLLEVRMKRRQSSPADTINTQTEYYNNLQQQIHELTASLAEKDVTIRKLRTEQSLDEEERKKREEKNCSNLTERDSH